MICFTSYYHQSRSTCFLIHSSFRVVLTKHFKGCIVLWILSCQNLQASTSRSELPRDFLMMYSFKSDGYVEHRPLWSTCDIILATYKQNLGSIGCSHRKLVFKLILTIVSSLSLSFTLLASVQLSVSPHSLRLSPVSYSPY